MIPKNNNILEHDFIFKEETSKTYKKNIDKEEINGYTDEKEAIEQGIYLILNIERYEYLIYTWNYGIELKDLYGKEISYVIPEIKRRIKEALTQDSRILSVDAFSFKNKKNKLNITFIVNTIFGDIKIKKDVKI